MGNIWVDCRGPVLEVDPLVLELETKTAHVNEKVGGGGGRSPDAAVGRSLPLGLAEWHIALNAAADCAKGGI